MKNYKKMLNYVLQKAKDNENEIQNLVYYEARCAAWISIGIPPCVAYKIAESDITPKELQNIIKQYKIKGISNKSILIIKKFNKSDFKNFTINYEKFKSEDSWTWKFSEWYNNLPNGCTYGEYQNKKSYFKKQILNISNKKIDIAKIFKEVEKSDDEIKNLAYYEARGTSWILIGMPGNFAYVLATKDVNPKRLKAKIKKYSIKGIGAKTIAIIEQFNEFDFQKFRDCYNQLRKKRSWTWRLSRWYNNLTNGCTNGEYIDKKALFKRHYNIKAKPSE